MTGTSGRSFPKTAFPVTGRTARSGWPVCRLDTFEGATADRNGHAALTPGQRGDERSVSADHGGQRGPTDAATVLEPPADGGADRDRTALDRGGGNVLEALVVYSSKAAGAAGCRAIAHG